MSKFAASPKPPSSSRSVTGTGRNPTTVVKPRGSGKSSSRQALVSSNSRPDSGYSKRSPSNGRRTQRSPVSSANESRAERGGSSQSRAEEHESEEGGKDDELIFTPREVNRINSQEIFESSGEKSFAEVYEIDLHSASLVKIQNLEKFTKLRVLDLSCNFISSIENLEAIEDLRELKLYSNQIGQIKNLDQLAQLTNLLLQYNRIRQIGRGLCAARKLKTLRLDNNRLGRLEPRELAACSQLTCLDLSSNRLEDLAALNSLPCLQELNASHNRLTAVKDLSRCKKLQDVDLCSNQLTDISGLRRLQLRTLAVAHNRLAQQCFKGFGRMLSLQDLDLSHNRFTLLHTLVDSFPALDLLNVRDNGVDRWEEVCHLSGLEDLTELQVAGNPFAQQHQDYRDYLVQRIPSLEVLDGVTTRRPGSAARAPPVMRPMSASTAVSTRQVENQLRTVENDLASYQSSLMAKFLSLKSAFDSLPSQEEIETARYGVKGEGSQPSSRCSSRNRIADARSFAAQHYKHSKSTH